MQGELVQRALETDLLDATGTRRLPTGGERRHTRGDDPVARRAIGHARVSIGAYVTRGSAGSAPGHFVAPGTRLPAYALTTFGAGSR